MDKRLLNQVFDSVVERRGKAAAVVDGARRIGYLDLQRYANAVANQLLRLKVDNSRIVGIFLEHSIEYIASILGVMKSGAVFMPLNPDFPPARNRLVLGKTEPVAIITVERFVPLLRELYADQTSKPAVMALPESAGDLSQLEFLVDGVPCPGDTDLPRIRQDGDDNCYIINTSGTTGEPKVILGRHKGMSHFIHWEIGEFHLDSSTAIPVFAPPTFDVSLRDIFAPLIAGGTTHIPPDDAFRNITQLIRWIDNSKLTLLHIVPSLFRLLLSELESQGEAASILFPALRQVLLAGEPLLGRDVNRWRRIFGDRIELVNLYGPTESTLAKCFNRLTETDYPDEKLIPVGNPISNTAVLILKENQLCPIGTIGEIHIKSPFITKGYYRDEELTRQAFVQNPLSETPDVIYRTGDMGRYLPDRRVELLGRLDRQVKVNGNRIELGDVEAAVLKQSGVDQCFVNTVNRQNAVNLVCYFSGQRHIGSELLRKRLQGLLPEYAIPSYFVKLEQFPLTLNGKVDKRKLPRPEELLYATIPYEAPVTVTEEKLTHSWAEILGIPKVGVNNPFFDLGGTSLSAIKLTSEIFGLFQVNITLRDILQNPTVRQLAAIIEDSAGVDHSLKIERQPKREYYPISAAQRRLWFLNQLPGGDVVNNMPGAWRISGRLDFDLMERSFNLLIERHESLRTGFKVVDGKPAQVIHPSTPLRFKYLPLPPEADEAAFVKQAFREEVQTPFDLEKPPLIRCLALRKTDQECVVILTVHHIIADGLSLDIIANELFRLYGSLAQDLPADLPELEFQYKDYSAWQAGFLASSAGKAHENYWKEQFAEKVEPVDFPLDFPRRSLQTFAGRALKRPLPENCRRFLTDLAEKEKTTIFAVLTSVVKAVIFKYTRQSDITIGTAIAGRDHPELAGQIGLYANLVALRDRLDGSQSFLQLLKQVKRTAEQGLIHQSYPYDHLVEILTIDRSIARSPLFDITIALQEDTLPIALPSGISIESLELDWELSRYDLMFTFKLTAGGILADLAYNSDLFDSTSIEYLWDHLITLIERIAEDPHQPLDKVAMVSASESRLLEELSFSERHDRIPVSVIDLIEAFATENERHPALSNGSKTLTYGQLSRLTNGVANRLLERNLPPETIVGVRMSRGMDPLLIQMGILKAGLAYMPLDPGHPAERLQTILRQSGCRYLVTDDPAAAADRGFDIEACWKAEELIAESPLKPMVELKPDSLAYTLFTSGSTGVPKGVMIEHQGLANSILGMAKSFGVTPQDHALQFASLVFDASMCEVYTALTQGATLYVLSQREVDNTDLLLQFLDQHRISLMVLPPILAHSFNRRELPWMRMMVTAGESPYREDVSFYLERMGYINAYGPTECSICISTHRVRPEDVTRVRIPIGIPIPNLGVKVLDETLTPTPIGVPGELFATGTGVGRGYINDPEQTARIFARLPQNSQARAYRTGDLARWLPDGTLEYLGRLDKQVKVRGYRIEIGEIEQALGRHPGVSQVAVIDALNENHEKILAAFFTRRDPARASEAEPFHHAEIRRALSKSLPEYMIPQRFLEIEAIPLTSSGKIDRVRLEKRLRERPETAKPADRPKTEMEERIYAVWKSVLNQPEVGIHDDFFAIGGDSIKAIQIVARLFQEGLQISVADIFEQSSIAGCAQVAQAAAAASPSEEVTGAVPLTPIQRWFFELHTENPHHFHQSVTLKSKSELDEKALRRALKELLRAHDMLRTHYRVVEGEITQEILAVDEVEIDPVVRDLREGQRPLEALDKELDALHRSIHLERAPLVKAGLFRLKDGDLLHFAIHHLIVDGVSWRILMDDFVRLYDAHRQGLAIVLSRKSSSFKVWSERLTAAADTDQMRNEVSFWNSQYDESDLPLICDFEPEDESAYTVDDLASRRSVIDPQQSKRLVDVLTSNKVEIGSFLLAVFLKSIRSLHRTDRVVVQLEGHGREDLFEDLDLSRTVGWFTSVYPLTVKIPANLEMPDVVSAVVAAKNKIPLKGVRYGILRYLTAVKPGVAGVINRSPRVRFNYLGQFGNTSEDSRFEMVEDYQSKNHAQDSPLDVDLTLEAMISGEALIWRLDYNRRLFAQAAMESLVERIASDLNSAGEIDWSKLDQRETTARESDADWEGLELEG